MKKAARLMTALLCAALLCTAALAFSIPSPTSDFYVCDNADVLSSETEAHIMDTSPALADETGAQVVVLTVDSLDGEAIEDYGLAVLRDWGIGDADKDNGLLILLSTGDRKIRIEVGYGLEGAINDAKAGRLIRDYAQDYYAVDEFDAGTLELYNAAVSLVREEYGLSPLEGYEAAGAEDEEYSIEDDEITGESWLILAGLVIFMLIVFSPLVVAIINVFRLLFHKPPLRGGCLYGGGGFRGGRGGFGGGSGFGGGGFGGGGFSGGGGSGGGGGASGSF